MHFSAGTTSAVTPADLIDLGFCATARRQRPDGLAFVERTHSYPVMRYLLGRDALERDGGLDRLIRFFVMARVLRGEPILAVAGGAGITAVALVSYPDGPPSPPELDTLRWLLDEVHGLSRVRAGSTGVALTTEVPENVALYERFGYQITGHARVDTDLETWALFRPC